MAALTAVERNALSALFCEEVSRGRSPLALTRAQLRAALDAVDQWVEDNVSSFNAAIPQPARGSLTARQKAALFFYVVQKRLSNTL